MTAAWADRAVISEDVCWTSAHEDVGSRQNGWKLLCERLNKMMKRDRLRLFAFNTCRQFIRTAPPRDEIDMDDVDSKAEDHVGGETQYRLLSKEQRAVAR